MHGRRDGVVVTRDRCGRVRRVLRRCSHGARRGASLFTGLASSVRNRELGVSSVGRRVLGSSNMVAILGGSVLRGRRDVTELGRRGLTLSNDSGSTGARVALGCRRVGSLRTGGSRLSIGLRRLRDGLSRLLDRASSDDEEVRGRVHALGALATRTSSGHIALIATRAAVHKVRTQGATSSRLVSTGRGRIRELGNRFRRTRGLVRSLSRGLSDYGGSLGNCRLQLSTESIAMRGLGRRLSAIGLSVRTGGHHVRVLHSLRGGVRNFTGSIGFMVSGTRAKVLENVYNPISSLVAIRGGCDLTVRATLGGTVRGVIARARTSTGTTVGFLGDGGTNETAFLPITAVGTHRFGRCNFRRVLNCVKVTDSLIGYSGGCLRVIGCLLNTIIITRSVSYTIAVTEGFNCQVGIMSLSNRIMDPNNSLANNSIIGGSNVLDHDGSVVGVRGRIGRLAMGTRSVGRGLGRDVTTLTRTGTSVATLGTSVLATGRSGVHTLSRLGHISSVHRDIVAALGRLASRRALNSDGLIRLGRVSIGVTHRLLRVSGSGRDVRSMVSGVANSHSGLGAIERSLSGSVATIGLSIVRILGSVRTARATTGALRDLSRSHGGHILAVSDRVTTLRFGYRGLHDRVRDIGSDVNSTATGVSRDRRVVTRSVRGHGTARGVNMRLHGDRHRGALHHRRVDKRLTHLRRHGSIVVHRCSSIVHHLCSRCRLAEARTRRVNVRVGGPTRTGHALDSIGGGVHSLNGMGISTVRRCGRIDRECGFLSRRVGSIRTSQTRLRGLVGRLASRVRRVFTSNFRGVDRGFSGAFARLFNNKATSLSLSSPRGVLRDKVSVGIGLPNGGMPDLSKLSNNRGTLVTLSVCFTVVHMGTPPFYFLSRISATLSSVGIRHFTSCVGSDSFGARFVYIARHHNAVRTTSVLCNMAVRRGNVAGLLRLGMDRLRGGLLGGRINW